MKSKLKKSLFTLVAMFFIAAAGVQWANAQAVTVNWMQWNAPSSYPNALDAGGYSYAYADGASGQLTLPGGTVVYFKMDGEVADWSGFGFFSWDGSYGDGSYLSPNVPSTSTNLDMVAQTGYGSPESRVHTVRFYSDVAMTIPTSVQNIVMTIYSLGDYSNNSAYQFDQDFVILSQSPNCSESEPQGSDCMWKEIQDSKPTVVGFEGRGTIQFTGTFSSFSWNVTAPEVFSGFNIGVTSAGSEPPPPPGPPCSVAHARTLTEPQWHSRASFNPLSQHWFAEKFPRGLMVGKGSRKVTLTSDGAVRDFLPQGPRSAILLTEWTNPGKKLRNSLAGQLTAAKLNLALSPGLTKAFVASGTRSGFDGMTFQQIIDAADSALGWNGSGSMPTMVQLDAFNNILIHINKSFSNGDKRSILVCEEGH